MSCLCLPDCSEKNKKNMKHGDIEMLLASQQFISSTGRCTAGLGTRQALLEE